MSMSFESEYCRFYPYCSYSNHRKIICRKGNWLKCRIYKNILDKFLKKNIDIIKLTFQLTIELDDNDYNKLYDGKLFEIKGIFRYPSKATRITFKEVK